MMRLLLCVVTILVSLAGAPASAQQAYPERIVRLVVSSSPGGGTDIVARIVAAELSTLWGQTVVVENRAGAGGNIAAQAVVRSRPDGYNLLVAYSGVLTTNRFLYTNPGFDAEKDLVPVSLLATGAYIMVANPEQTQVRSVQALVAQLKAEQPKNMMWASAAKGSSEQLAGELFSQTIGVPMTNVSYKGAADALMDVVAGRVPVGIFSIPTAISHLRAGKLVPLGVTDSRRAPLLPDVPTLAEAGLSGFEARAWFGVWAPAGTPQAIIDKFQVGVRTVLANPAIAKRLAEGGFDPGTMTTLEFDQFVRSETQKYEKVINKIGLQKIE